MELRPHWKMRWLVIALLMLPTLVWFAYSLLHPSAKKNGEKLYRLVEVPVHAEQTSPWTMQESGTTAGLRGIYSVDGKVAWASGTVGTVLKTVDGGEHWQKCAVPGPDGETLDFRGVQAWDATEAIVMASGPGEKSRLYKTTDGCASWMELARNHDKDGFWDGLRRAYLDDGTHLLLLGDPVGGRFFVRGVNASTGDLKPLGEPNEDDSLRAAGNAGAFAASNSSLTLGGRGITRARVDISIVFGTGGTSGAAVYRTQIDEAASKRGGEMRWSRWVRIPVPLAGSNVSSGVFSVASRSGMSLITVGGDYEKPNESVGTAAYSKDGGMHWTAATKPPHGYRSSVAWSKDQKAWITVGTNGSDISRDDDKTWQPLDNGNWNALSLPFVVGPNGRIARLSNSSNLPK
jgi:photosystem II stability/assembly factor-like uncharacterized protein